MRKIRSRICLIIILLWSLFSLLSSTLSSALTGALSGSFLVQAQGSNIRLRIEAIIDNQFPNLETYLSVTDVLGFPVKDLTASNFSFTEDGKTITALQLDPVYNTDQALSFVLLIDTSGSMAKTAEEDPMQEAKDAAKAFVDGLGPNDQVAVIAFSDDVSVKQELTSDKELVKSAIDILQSKGATAMYDAVVKGVELVKTRPERRVIILVTDGKESGQSTYALDEAISEAVRWATPVYPIGFGEVDDAALTKIAALTGGAAQVKPNSDQLKEALDTVVQTLREQYLVKFASSLPADAREHTLVTSVNYEGWEDQDTATFTARPGSITLSLPGFSNGQEIAGEVLFAPEVIAPAATKSLDIAINGSPTNKDVEAPFDFAWDSATVSPGDYEIKFKVEDTAGNTGEMVLNLVVRPPIRLKITSPANADEISGRVTISAEVDSFATLDKVEFLTDGEVLETLNKPPFTVEWVVARVKEGTHEIKVVAYDVLNHTAEDQVKVVKAAASLNGTLGPAIILVLVLAAILIPVGILARRRVKKSVSTGASPHITGSASLYELQGHNPGHTWQLFSQEVRLGRKADENDIRLKGTTASRRHALIRLQNGQYWVESSSLDNPVMVNNLPVLQPQVLLSGDTIQAGESVFRFDRQA